VRESALTDLNIALTYFFCCDQDYLNQLMTNTDKVVDLLETKNDIIDRPDAVELYECRGDIAFENVTFMYEPPNEKSKKPPRKALDGVSFEVKAGQHVALVGETGSGKSTIFRLLFRFFDASEGSVKVDGLDVREYTQSSLRKALGIVQQEVRSFSSKLWIQADFLQRLRCSTTRL
jgi:ATP-binding cassette subfamily B (MDR/TAP) protein 6